MSDEQNNPAPEAEKHQETPAQEIDWKAMARKHEERSKAANAELEELRKRAAKLDEIEESQRTEAEKLAEKVAKAEARAAELEAQVKAKDREVLASRVAAEKKVPAKYLTGDTEEELMASADAFLEDIKGIATSRPEGVVPSAGTGSPKPQAASLDTGRERALNLLNAQSK